MQIIDSNQDGVISFSEYLVIAYFINLRVGNIRHIFDDCAEKTDEKTIEHLWNKFLDSGVFKSITTNTAIDARATSVTLAQLRLDFDHVVNSVIKKYGKLNSFNLEKLYNVIMEDVFYYDF